MGTIFQPLGNTNLLQVTGSVSTGTVDTVNFGQVFRVVNTSTNDAFVNFSVGLPVTVQHPGSGQGNSQDCIIVRANSEILLAPFNTILSGQDGYPSGDGPATPVTVYVAGITISGSASLFIQSGTLA